MGCTQTKETKSVKIKKNNVIQFNQQNTSIRCFLCFDQKKQTKNQNPKVQPDKQEMMPIMNANLMYIIKTFRRTFKVIRLVADFLDLKTLTRFGQCSRSFYWVAGRQSVLCKFTREDQTTPILRKTHSDKQLEAVEHMGLE